MVREWQAEIEQTQAKLDELAGCGRKARSAAASG